MIITPDTTRGKAVLTLAHVAGMIDMVALPVWIGALMQYYRYSPSQAGITVTLFLLGVLASSAVFAPRFNRLPRRMAATMGFALAAVAFFFAGRQPVDVSSFGVLAALHALGGLGVGCSLTFTHGCIGRSANPHRLFAVVNTALGVFAVIFLGGMPQLILHMGASLLFAVVAVIMAVAAVVMALSFPDVPERAVVTGDAIPLTRARIPRAAWFIIAVIVCLALNQAMVFSFLERIGAERGFGIDRVNGVLIALGLVNLMPGLLAALLQTKWSPLAVGFAGPIGQAVLALVMSSTLVFGLYAATASFYVFMVIFTHTFLFGLLSRLDPSGRATAATPAMMTMGASIGPVLGGVIVQGLGYPGLGWVTCFVACFAAILMWRVRCNLSRSPVAPVGAAA